MNVLKFNVKFIKGFHLRQFTSAVFSSVKVKQQKQGGNHQTLTDTFGRMHSYLRISVSERCNLRCTYCMPAEGVKLQPKDHLLTNDEIYYLAKIFVKNGVRKIRLTGGEPTVRRDIVEIVENLSKIPQIESIGITTNGLVLTRLLVPLQRAGLNSINISLDTLKSSKYEHITRRKGWEKVIAGIDLAVQLGYKPKINCVLMKDFNDNEICDFVEFTKDRNIDVRFIEYMPFSGNKWHTDKLVPFKSAMESIKEKFPDLKTLPNGPNDTSKAFEVPNFKGQLGFITSMTEHFCGSCNRLRITADGNLKVCLFGNREISLRDAIRANASESDLEALISSAVQRKKKQHADKPWNYQLSFTSLSHSFLRSSSPNSSFIRFYSNHLTHTDLEGNAKMVDVTAKPVTDREAIAKATVYVGPKVSKLINDNNLKKGDVLTVAQLAGIIGAKKTSDLIPLCHNIPLSSVEVQCKLDTKNHSVEIISKVKCSGKTGVEMEALSGVAVAALTVYDMCKAVSHSIVIKDLRLLEKTGGKNDFRYRDGPFKGELTTKQSHDPASEELFYPIHI